VNEARLHRYSYAGQRVIPAVGATPTAAIMLKLVQGIVTLIVAVYCWWLASQFTANQTPAWPTAFCAAAMTVLGVSWVHDGYKDLTAQRRWRACSRPRK